MPHDLITVFGTVILRRDDETAALPRSSVNGFYDVNELVDVIERPVDLVIITGAQIDHDVLVAEKEHEGARIVKLVHGVEVGNL